MKQNFKVLCQINDIGFTSKPTDIRFMGKLRDKMIQRGWIQLPDYEFVRKVTEEGTAFYGCLFNGRDLMETGQQRLCWRMQTMIGVDFDHCPVSPERMVETYAEAGSRPWLVYPTFSDGTELGLRSYRLLWKCEHDLNATYEQWADVIKSFANFTQYGDPRARDCSRMWQGGLKGFSHYDANAHLIGVNHVLKRA
jgi:hypothetical protein